VAQDSPDPLVGRLVGERYLLKRRIGRGGMGTVYEARQEPLGRRVALKLLRPHLAEDASSLARFQREAEMAAQLGHPNIVQVTDFGRSADGGVFLIMELLEGQPLAAAIAAGPPFTAERVAWIAWQVLSALEAAHAAGIVHRDLKPDNVFLCDVPGVDDFVKLLDFGIAKLAERHDAQGLTATGAILGTPLYMAPEQAQGRAVDARTDIYAVGAIAYEALTGRPPHDGPNYNAVLASVLTSDPTPLSALRPELSPVITDVVTRALSREPGSRFDSATAMRLALEPLLADRLRGTPTSRRTSELGEATAPTLPSGNALAVVGAPTPGPVPARAAATPAGPPERSPARGVPMTTLLLVALAIVGIAAAAATTGYLVAGRDSADTAVTTIADQPPAPPASPAGSGTPMLPAVVPLASPPAPTIVQPADPPQVAPPAAPPAPPIPSPVPEAAPPSPPRVGDAPRPPARPVQYSGGMTNNRYPLTELRRAAGVVAPRATRCRHSSRLVFYTWRLQVDGEGQVVSAEVMTNQPGTDAERQCMHGVVMAIRFEGPPAGGPGEMRVWFTP